MLFLKQSTAVTVKIGPFLDSTDGNTAETGLTISQADVRLSKNGANIAQKNDATACTHDELGVYDCPLSTTDTNTTGRLQLWVHESGALQVWHEYMVVPANVYDSLVGGTDSLEVDATAISGDTTAADNAESFFDGTGYAGTNNVIPTVTTVGTVTTNTDLVTAAAVRAEMDSNSTQLAAIVADTNELQTDDVPGLIAGLNDPTAAAIADAVLDEALSGHTTAGTLGKAVADIETDATAILADTNELQTDDIPGAIAALNNISTAEVNTEVDSALSDIGLDHLLAAAVAGTDITDDSIIAQLVSASVTADWDDFDNTTESLQAIRDRGDSAWITGGGGGITDILNVQPLIPESIDLADTATWRVGLMLINSLDDLPTTAEITPGTIDIDYKSIGETSWTSAVSGAACSELAGLIYYDEVFDSGTGYAEGDSIRLTFKSQKITVSANDYEISDTNGRIFYTEIRQTSGGSSAADIADAVLDEALSGHTTAGTLGKAIADIETDATAILADTNELQTDDVPGLIAALNNISTAQVNAEVDTALADIHLDHLLAADYDPASKPGTATALLNELVENDSGVSRFTANALEQAPGGSAPSASAIATAVHEYVVESGNPTNSQTFEEIMRIVLATLVGVRDTTYDFGAKSPDGVTTRVGGTLNSSGERVSIDLLDGS